jgi:predicted HD phosphohydrolase
MTEPIATAEDLARELLARMPDRLAHTEGVAPRVEEDGTAFEPDEAADLVAAAWLHDVGYAPWVAGIQMHALDGGWFLQGRHYPERVCQLVAHHSGARFEAREGLPRPVSALGSVLAL